ncbi:MAG: cytochrome c maturation protein CcmE [Deltaproteobacteria bacterium]
MRGLKKKQRVQVIALIFAALVLAFALMYFGFSNGINLFRSPTQVIADVPKPTEVFRIGGLIEKGTLVKGMDNQATFTVTDGNAAIPVTYTGFLPDLIAEEAGVVAKGTYVDGVFVASEILAKHDEKYMPKEVIDALKAQGTYVEPGS